MNFCSVLFCLLVSVVVLVSCDSGEVKLPKPITGVQACVPFNVIVRPSWKKGFPYRVFYEADAAVIKALDVKIVGTTVVVETKASFNTKNFIRFFVEVPKNQLQSVSLSGSANMLIQGAFKVQKLSITHSGSGIIYVPSATTANRLSINNKGSGIVAYDGPILNLNLNAELSSKTYITSIGGNINYSGSGLSKTYIQPAKNTIKVTGKANSLAEVTVGGTSCNKICKVTGTSRFRTPCKCATKVVSPASIKKPTYSCGLKVDGKSTCTTATSATAVVSNGVSYSRAFSSSSSGGSSALAVASQTCTRKAADLFMKV